jgi:hypothetical protein
LAIGVNYDLFWTLNPADLKPFARAFDIKRNEADVLMWQQGMYIRIAIASCLDKNAKYPTKPFGLATKKSEANDEDKMQKEIRLRFMTHASMLNTRFRKEK